MRQILISIVVAASVVSCATTPDDSGTSWTLEETHQKATRIFPGPTSLQLFACSRDELMSLLTSEVYISRIGTGATELNRQARQVSRHEDGALLGRLVDFQSYLEPTVCDFDPAIRLTATTSMGTYEFDVCFACSEIAIRLPASQRRLHQLRRFGMRPELRLAMLQVAQLNYPHDAVLKKLYPR